MSLKELSISVNKCLINFLWRQWAQLGVAGHIDYYDNWIIDPEALILFSMNIGRYDARLFDEIYDWILKNERWISIQRIKALLRRYDDKQTIQTLTVIARSVETHQKNTRWKSLANQSFEQRSTVKPFFLTISQMDLPIIQDPDPIFSSVGWIRSTPKPRGLSQNVPMSYQTNLIFLMRSLFGLSPKAEITAYLIHHLSASASDIAYATGYTRPPIHESLNDLLSGGFVELKSAETGRTYGLSNRWHDFLQINNLSTIWIDWQRVFIVLNQMHEFLYRIQDADQSDYLIKSNMLSLAESLDRGFVASAIPNPFSGHYTLDNVSVELPKGINKLMSLLAPADQAQTK
jgi:hypothetical protein